jgi:hypothetical protein
MADIRDRLLPFNCFSFPDITENDVEKSYSDVLTPLCDSLLERKRKLEQDFRCKFNRYNSELTMGEDVLINDLLLKSDQAVFEETKRKRFETKKIQINSRPPVVQQQQSIRPESTRPSMSYNNNQYTVQSTTIDDGDAEHDNAVKGLLDNF